MEKGRFREIKGFFHKVFKKQGLVLLVALILGIGFYFRSSNIIYEPVLNTVSSYYFDKSQRLVTDGYFPKEDIWDFAPSVRKENAPPFLAYFTRSFYKIYQLVGGLNLEDFVKIFPLAMYGLWSLSLFFVFYDLWGTAVAIYTLAIFSFLPVSVSLTTMGYFEETVGTWLIFLGVYFLIKVAAKPDINRFFAASLLVNTALVLAWQQFPVFYISSVPLFIFWILSGNLSKKNAVLLLFFLLSPLLLAEVLSRVLIGIDYSPLAMIKEYIYAFWHRSDPDLISAMSRSDWANISFSRFWSYFGLSGLFLIFWGWCSIALDLRKKEKQIIGVFNLVGFAFLLFFVKERFLALSLFLYVMALGVKLILEPGVIKEKIGHIWEYAGFYLRHLKIKMMMTKTGLVLVLALAAVWGGLVFYRNFYRFPPLSHIIIEAGGVLRLGQSQKIAIKLENIGGPSLAEPFAFGGLHVEVENAEVRNISASSPFTDSQAVVKNFSRSGNVFFFETKYDYLDSNEFGWASFEIIPYAEPVLIYYRSWLPGICPDEKRREVLKDLLPGWSNLEKSGWRNEECIKRSPPNDENKENFCRIPVMAAHQTLQNFRCFSQQVEVE